MNTTRLTKTLSLLLCTVLIAVMALVCTGCNDKAPADAGSSNEGQTVEATTTVLGAYFTFSVVDVAGKETVFEVHTDKKTVGEALLAYGLIAGEESAYGLYVKTVNGVTLDYDKDGKYWAFYADGKYASAGVDTTDIVSGTTYAFKAE